MTHYQADLQQIDSLLDGAEPFLAEALKSIQYPECYSILDPKSQTRAIEKLRSEIEWVAYCVRQARGLSELAWGDDDDLDPEPQVTAAEAAHEALRE